MAHATDSPRKVPMRVLALGVSRTGTTSMQAALEQLGYGHVAHGWDLMARPSQCAGWEKAIDAKYFGKGTPLGREEFDEFLGDCQAITDMPGFMVADELLAAYPEAKVVLCEREVESWFRSYSTTVVPPTFSFLTDVICYCIEPSLGLRTTWLVRKCLLGFFKAKDGDEVLKNARTVYREYYAHIREVVPPENLLNCELALGWKPLCDFLGVEAPDTPFPRVNESEAMKERIWQTQVVRVKQGLHKLSQTVLPALVVGAGVMYWYRGMR